MNTVAALYVQKGGVYYGVSGVEPWGMDRDARTYAGPYPVVAHPPCARWGRYWSGGPSHHGKFKLGDDKGCFAASLESVRRWGGVIEHPEGSHAWAMFGLNAPPRRGGRIVADFQGGWTSCVEQGWYGHRARKKTWLYAHSVELSSLNWGAAPGRFVRLDDGYNTADERRKAVKRGAAELLSHREREATPVPFRDLLIGIARSHYAVRAVA